VRLQALRLADWFLVFGIVGVVFLALVLVALAPPASLPSGLEIIRGAFRADQAADYSSRTEQAVAPQRRVDVAGVKTASAPTAANR